MRTRVSETKGYFMVGYFGYKQPTTNKARDSLAPKTAGLAMLQSKQEIILSENSVNPSEKFS